MCNRNRHAWNLKLLMLFALIFLHSYYTAPKSILMIINNYLNADSRKENNVNFIGLMRKVVRLPIFFINLAPLYYDVTLLTIINLELFLSSKSTDNRFSFNVNSVTKPLRYSGLLFRAITFQSERKICLILLPEYKN